ncbi:MAG: ATP-binding protein, partial [Comamonas sp.]
VWGDIDGLAIVLRNLIENALRHTQGAVVLQVQPAPHAALVVRDGGAGLSAEEIQKIQQRHARMDRQHIGYGLGMSIVKTIADKHGAALTFTSPPEGFERGLEVTLVFVHATNGAKPQRVGP